MSDKAGEHAAARPDAENPNIRQALDQVHQALRGLRFGEVCVTVQDGFVVQIERTERKRLDRPARGHGDKPKE
jgi:hypothetical protein